MQLYRAVFKVEPAKHHPLFWDMQFGFLFVWVFAHSLDDAGERAGRMVSELPYEQPEANEAWKGSEWKPNTIRPAGGLIVEELVHKENSAKKLGGAFHLYALPTGMTEEEFWSLVHPEKN